MGENFQGQLEREVQEIRRDAYQSVSTGIDETKSFLGELYDECLPSTVLFSPSYWKSNTKSILSWLHVPYLPSLHSPGWLTRYIVGPYDGDWFEGIFSDFWAGITVALTLVPQVSGFFLHHYLLLILLFLN